MRLIDADGLEDDMFNLWKQNEISNGEWIQFREILNQQPTAQQWISCSERLPEEIGTYLITEEDGSVLCDTFLSDFEGWIKTFPIAWMPLPEPYKENES